jgi:hypothetical protein
MSIKVRSSLLSSVIIAVLFFSAVGPTIVYADGGPTTDTPPTETTTECASDGTTNECSSEAVTVEAPAAPDVSAPAAEEPSAGGNEPSAEAAPAEQTTTLNDVPENTTVAVVNAEGQAEPLATQAAAEALATTSDPIWCPAAQTTPTPGANGCTSSFTSFNALLTFLAGNASFQGAGTIFVQQGAYNGGESSINFSNYNLSNISNADLTITGGWNTSNNTVTGTSSFNNVPILIGTTNPWGGTLTINNLSMSNPSGTGLVLVSQADINLTNVTVTNSTNGAGADLNAVGDVTIEGSHFDRNKTAGAIIRHARNVAIRNSTFSNPPDGRRQNIGLDVTADGSVSLLDVVADQNRNVGANIKAGGSVVISISRGPNGEPLGISSFSGTKNIVGSNFFGYGLQIDSQNSITLDGITANDNFLWGASLKSVGDVTIANSTFNANTTESPGFIDDTGLIVDSGGKVSIDSSHADDNRLIGATIKAAGDVAIKNSTFSNNQGTTLDSAGKPTFHGYGLNVVTPGNISLTSVVASNNMLFGAHLEAGSDVNVLSSDFSNQTSGVATDQTGRGLEVISGGLVILDTVTLNNNQTFGANIQASDGIFLDSVTATGNGQNGVEVQGNCTTLFLIDGTYSNNGQYGLSITDMQLSQSGSPIFATNGAGDIFQNPTTCVFPVNAPSTPPVDNGASGTTTQTDTTTAETVSTVYSLSSSSAGAFRGIPAIGSFIEKFNSDAGNVTLNSFLANSSLAQSTHVGLFIGKYVYIYSMYGMQIFAYYPTLDNVAMVGPH